MTNLRDMTHYTCNLQGFNKWQGLISADPITWAANGLLWDPGAMGINQIFSV